MTRSTERIKDETTRFDGFVIDDTSLTIYLWTTYSLRKKLLFKTILSPTTRIDLLGH